MGSQLVVESSANTLTNTSTNTRGRDGSATVTSQWRFVKVFVKVVVKVFVKVFVNMFVKLLKMCGPQYMNDTIKIRIKR